MLKYAATSTDLAQIATWLQALSHPNRLSIYDMLMEGVQCNCEIHNCLGLSFSLISHHMHILEQAGLVVSERDAEDGRWIYYSIDRQALAKLSAALGQFLDGERIQSRLPSCGPRAMERVPTGECGAPCHDGACRDCES